MKVISQSQYNMWKSLFFVFLALMAASAPVQGQGVVEEVLPGVDLSFPVEVATAPGQLDRLYVVEKGEESGEVPPARVISIGQGETEPTVFLDITNKAWSGGEAGLFGIAFHPDYEANGRVFVYYTPIGPERSIIEEYTRSSEDPLVVDPETARTIIEIPQNVAIHNGGGIEFGPDGYLYLALGDGGPEQGDPENNSQDTSNLLGSVIRLDVDGTGAEQAYLIPGDNPFLASSDVKDEVFAYGFRNPWKISFDSETGDLWVGDVGQNRWEEINVARSGGNYGWRMVEGSECYVEGCDLSQYDAPVYSYPHDASPAGGFSITGGFVYRGSAIPGLYGKYLFADFVLPKLWALTPDSGSGVVVDLLPAEIPNISSIDEDANGEPLLVSISQGKIYRLVGITVSNGETPDELSPSLNVTGANPFRTATSLEVRASGGVPARVVLYDVIGREIDVLYDGIMPGSGVLSLPVSARGLAPGVVFAHLETPSRRVVQRLTLVR